MSLHTLAALDSSQTQGALDCLQMPGELHFFAHSKGTRVFACSGSTSTRVFTHSRGLEPQQTPGACTRDLPNSGGTRVFADSGDSAEA